MYLLLKNILFSKKIILLQSYLQILNFKELINSKKIFNENLSGTIVLSHHIKDSYFLKIKKLLKKLNIKNVPIQCTKNYHIKLSYFFLRLRKFFFNNFELVITGNVNSYLDREFINLSNKTIILDDGNNIFDNNFQKFKLPNCKIFSIFDSFFFKKHDYEINKYFFLKKKLKKISGYSQDIYFLGNPYVEIFNVKKHDYLKLLEKTFSYLGSRKKIFYVPHPKEETLYLKKHFKNLKILEISDPIELHLLNKKKYPKLVTSFGSTAMITLKKISNKFNLINLNQKGTFKGSFINKDRKKRINRYIKKIGIKSKKISIL